MIPANIHSGIAENVFLTIKRKATRNIAFTTIAIKSKNSEKLSASVLSKAQIAIRYTNVKIGVLDETKRLAIWRLQTIKPNSLHGKKRCKANFVRFTCCLRQRKVSTRLRVRASTCNLQCLSYSNSYTVLLLTYTRLTSRMMTQVFGQLVYVHTVSSYLARALLNN